MIERCTNRKKVNTWKYRDLKLFSSDIQMFKNIVNLVKINY